jgi:DNA-binding protein HU-beta
MTKQDLIDSVAGATGLSKGEAEKAMEATISGIKDGIRADARLSLSGFGTFTVRERAERQGRNPRTGEAITIKASKTVGFKPAPTLKDSL